MSRSLDIDLTGLVGLAVDIAAELERDAGSATIGWFGEVPASPGISRGVSGLERLVVLEASRRLSEELRRAWEDGAAHGSIVALAMAYRRFAIRHPGLYRSLYSPPGVESDPELDRALARPREQIAATLVDMGAGDLVAPNLAVACHSLLHGFVVLEREGGFGDESEVDRSFTLLIDALLATIEDHLG